MQMLSLDRLPCGNLLRGLGHGRTVATGARWATRCLRCGGDADASSTSEDSSCSAYARAQARRAGCRMDRDRTAPPRLGSGHHARATTTPVLGANPHHPPAGQRPHPFADLAALEPPATGQEWANVIDGPVSTPQPHDAADVDGVDRGAAFVELGPRGDDRLTSNPATNENGLDGRQSGRVRRQGGRWGRWGGAVSQGRTPAAQPNGEAVGAGEEGDVDVGELVDEPQPETGGQRGRRERG